jgi:GNAT superfamily N-acetyltransferase
MLTSANPLPTPSPPAIGITVRRVTDPNSIEMQSFWDLRTRILRPPGSPTCTFPGDEEAITIHLAAYDDSNGQLICVATLRPADAASSTLSGIPSEFRSPGLEWQLRGMATDTERRGNGVGRLILSTAAKHVREEGGKLLWCNAREIAIPFYSKCGWSIWSDLFDIPSVGPHVLMGLPIQEETKLMPL